MHTHKFCQKCSSPLPEGDPIQLCDSCGHSIWHNPTPVALVAILQREALAAGKIRFLAARRAIQPKIGGVCLPGGHVDFMETIEAAAIRELREETGLSLSINTPMRILGSITPEINKLLVFCAMPALPERIVEGFVPNREVSEILWQSWDGEWAFPGQMAGLRQYERVLTSFATKHSLWFEGSEAVRV